VLSRYFNNYTALGSLGRMEDMAMEDILPPGITQGAMLRGNEYSLSVSSSAREINGGG
jgi:hypothetical protein